MNNLYQIRQLDKKIEPLLNIKKAAMPVNGWINAIRKSLCMTQVQLARRLKVDPSRIKHIEDSEKAGNLKLNTLSRAANALNCELHYAFIPKDNSLMNLVQEQATAIAKKALMGSVQHMALEDQAVIKAIEEQIQDLVEELLHDKLKNLWNHEV